ncbi:MAG: TatD family hydrolase, partial [Chloroflexota bacterium]
MRSPEPDEGLVDSHAHLDAFPEAGLMRLLVRARRGGVGAILAPGVDLATSQRCVALAQRFSRSRQGENPRVLAAVGVHPAFLSAPLDGATLTVLRSLVSAPGVVAVGEVGLDAGGPSPSLQVEAFRLLLRLAREVDLPVVLHDEGETEAFLSIVEQEGVARRGAVLHYFTGDARLARRCLKIGLYLSVGRPLVRRPRLQRVVRELPLDRLLLETDAYPMPRRA